MSPEVWMIFLAAFLGVAVGFGGGVWYSMNSLRSKVDSMMDFSDVGMEADELADVISGEAQDLEAKGENVCKMGFEKVKESEQ